MRADPRFRGQLPAFWANVRSISQDLGYTKKKSKKSKASGQVRVYSAAEMAQSMQNLDLDVRHLTENGVPTALGQLLEDYFQYRADVLNTYVEPRLMDAEAARTLFEKIRGETNPHCPLPRNKQKGEKAGYAYLTCMVNMLIEAHADGVAVEYNPLELTTFTRDGAPIRTLARRVDGCFPSPVNPIAIWEIKEYYFTTTFGSRVADGVYETLLDGMELEALNEHEGMECEHVLMVDSHYTWWECGRSYLCRMIDMLNMGYVDEILFGREIEERLPKLVEGWVARHRARIAAGEVLRGV